MSIYFALLLLHVAAAVLFLGNVVVGLYWKSWADRAGDGAVIASALDALARSERWFTLPSAALLVGTGVWLARLADLPLLGTPWLAASLALLAISGLLFATLVRPLQRRLRSAALAGRTAEYRRVSSWWGWSGASSILAATAALVLMVIKP